MKKLLFVVISTIMISGLLLGSMGTSVFADVNPETNPGNANGCTKSNQDKGQAKNKNPHCEDVEPCNDPFNWYFDTDGDGFGGTGIHPDLHCTSPGDGWVDNSDDCNDEDKLINPDAAEITGNEIDENCNGSFDD